MADRTAPDLGFGDVLYDPERDAFRWRTGRDIKLRPQSLQLLKTLAGRADSVVDRDTLASAVWPDLHVGDDSIVQCVRDIRRALGDRDRSIVRTVPKRGYRLVTACARERGAPDRSRGEAVPPSLSSLGGAIRYVDARDGTKIAWTVHGQGVPLLFAPDWGTRSLDLELRSRLFGPFLERLGTSARIARFDRRGNGLSDRETDAFSLDADVEDMAKVADAAGFERMVLLGKHGGAAAAISFASRYPERVLGLVSMTGLVTGHLASGDAEGRRQFDVGMSLIEHGWDSTDPTYLRMIASRLAPNGPPEIWAEIAMFYTSTACKENARRQFELHHSVDVSDLAADLRVPLLVLHARDCKLTPFDAARRLASLVPDARLVAFGGEDFWPIPDTPAFDLCLAEILEFLSESGETRGRSAG